MSADLFDLSDPSSDESAPPDSGSVEEAVSTTTNTADVSATFKKSAPATFKKSAPETLKKSAPETLKKSAPTQSGSLAIADDPCLPCFQENQDDGCVHPVTGGLKTRVTTLSNAAKLLTQAGGYRITVEMIQADVAAGAPANADGTIDLIHYAAWLVKEMERAR
jgi:hypothetical protein